MGNRSFYGWKLLAAFSLFYLVNLSLPTYSWNVISRFMATALHLDRKMIGTAFSLYLLMIGLPGPLVAYMVNRAGVRWTIVTGGLFVSAGALFLAEFAHTGWQTVIGFGLLIGLGSCAGGALAEQAGLAKWFVRKRAFALSIMYAAGGLGTFITAPLLNRIILSTGGNWRAAWWAVAAAAIVATLLAALLIKERPSNIGQVPDGSLEEAPAAPIPGVARPRGGVHRTQDEWTYREALSSRTMWLMFLSAIGISIGFAMFQGQGGVLLKDLGYSSTAAAGAIGFMGVATVLGKLGAGLGDRIEPRYLWAIAMACYGAGLVLAVNAKDLLALYVLVTLLGMGWGGTLVSMMAVPINYFGPKAYPSIIGTMLLIQTGTSAVGPLGAGYLYDTYKSYVPPFYGTAALCFVGALLLLMATPPRRKAVEQVAAVPPLVQRPVPEI